jgi:hypothetical protein
LLKKAVTEWMRINDFDSEEAAFFTPSEWVARGGEYFEKAKLVMTLDSALSYADSVPGAV